ncbi:MAG: hypothetical protein JO131_08595 [Gammaproteobacteria bacterium]|nr:hypothetical protein [Gammaproteobacteria bacterium]
MKNRNDMTRICSICGVEKPLAAFLEISSSHGTRYGIICSACRGSGAIEKKITSDDEGTIVSTGARIGIKERIFIENEQKKKISIQKQERIDLLTKRDAILLDKTEKKIEKESQEKDHRRTYIDLKNKPSFLGKKLPAVTLVRPPATQQFPNRTDIKYQEDNNKQTKQILDKKFNLQEERKKRFALANQYIDPQSSEIRDNPNVSVFQNNLRETPFKIARDRLKKLTWTNKANEINNKKLTENKDPLLEFVEKTWGGPSTRKR